MGGSIFITILSLSGSIADYNLQIAFEVDDLDRLVSELKEKNIEFKLDNIVTPVCKMAVILDSEGNALTLHQLTKS